MKAKICLAAALLSIGLGAEAQSLKGSPESIGYQFLYAQAYTLPFLPDAEAVRFFIEGGFLVELEENGDYELFEVSHPYVLPTTRLFVEWFASGYRRTCGEKLFVTSATRPVAEQPPNAHPLSVHPTGMAVDFRRPNGLCRHWLEQTLLAFEEMGALDVTLEMNPWHYHVAVFPANYLAHLARLEE